jgi:hypothetical protein
MSNCYMNIFRVHDNPVASAMMLSDQHVIKMILESAQLLSTAHWVLDGHCAAYKSTHVNHPSAVWVRESRANYDWLFRHFEALINEHMFRYGHNRAHKAAMHLDVLRKAPRNLSGTSETPIRLAMPDYLKSLYSGSEAYRMYYSIHKRFNKAGKPYTWTNRPVPDWY